MNIFDEVEGVTLDSRYESIYQTHGLQGLKFYTHFIAKTSPEFARYYDYCPCIGANCHTNLNEVFEMFINFIKKITNPVENYELKLINYDSYMLDTDSLESL